MKRITILTAVLCMVLALFLSMLSARAPQRARIAEPGAHVLAQYGLKPFETANNHGPGYEERRQAWFALPADKGPRGWSLGTGKSPYWDQVYVWNIRTRQYELVSCKVVQFGGDDGTTAITTDKPFLGFDYDPQGQLPKIDQNKHVCMVVAPLHCPYNAYQFELNKIIAWKQEHGPNYEKDKKDWSEPPLRNRRGVKDVLVATYTEIPDYLCRPWKALQRYNYRTKQTVAYHSSDYFNAHKNRIVQSWFAPLLVRKVDLILVNSSYTQGGISYPYKYHEYRIYFKNDSMCMVLQYLKYSNWQIENYELNMKELDARGIKSSQSYLPDTVFALRICPPPDNILPYIISDNGQ